MGQWYLVTRIDSNLLIISIIFQKSLNIVNCYYFSVFVNWTKLSSWLSLNIQIQIDIVPDAWGRQGVCNITHVWKKSGTKTWIFKLRVAFSPEAHIIIFPADSFLHCLLIQIGNKFTWPNIQNLKAIWLVNQV